MGDILAFYLSRGLPFLIGCTLAFAALAAVRAKSSPLRYETNLWLAISLTCCLVWAVTSPLMWFYQFALDPFVGSWQGAFRKGMSLSDTFGALVWQDRDLLRLGLVTIAPLCLIGFSLVGNQMYLRRRFGLVPLPSRLSYISDKSAELANQMRIRPPTILLARAKIDSPFVCSKGFGRAILVVPENIESTLLSATSVESQRMSLIEFVIAHELSHIKNGDVRYATWAARVISATPLWLGFLLFLPFFVRINNIGLYAVYSAFALVAYAVFVTSYRGYVSRRELLADKDAIKAVNAGQALTQLAHDLLVRSVILHLRKVEYPERPKRSSALFNPLALMIVLFFILGPGLRIAKLPPLFWFGRPQLLRSDFWAETALIALLLFVLSKNLQNLVGFALGRLRTWNFSSTRFLEIFNIGAFRLIPSPDQVKQRLRALKGLPPRGGSQYGTGLGLGLLIPFLAISGAAAGTFAHWTGWTIQGKTLGSISTSNELPLDWFNAMAHLTFSGIPALTVFFLFLPAINVLGGSTKKKALEFSASFLLASLVSLGLFMIVLKLVAPQGYCTTDKLWLLPGQWCSVGGVLSLTQRIYATSLVSLIVTWLLLHASLQLENSRRSLPYRVACAAGMFGASLILTAVMFKGFVSDFHFTTLAQTLTMRQSWLGASAVVFTAFVVFPSRIAFPGGIQEP